MANENMTIQGLREQVARQKTLGAQLADLMAQRESLEKRERELAAERAEENKDVEQMEKGSLATLFYHMTGKFQDKLDKERQEAYAAAVRHDAVREELEAVKDRIRRTESERAELNGCERRYAQMLEEKLREMKETDPLTGPALVRLDERETDLTGQKKELREAISAGKAALGMTDTILSNLSSAENWGTWDLLGGGLLSDMAKHGHLDEAQRNVERLQVQLRNFRTELADVSINADLQIQVDGFLRFADFFFDGLFCDWAVQSKIHGSEQQVRETRDKVQRVLKQLEAMETGVDSDIRKVKAERESLIVSMAE